MRAAEIGDRWKAERMEVGADALFRAGTGTRRRRRGERSKRRVRVLDVVHDTLTTGLYFGTCTGYAAKEIERARRRTGTVGGGDGGEDDEQVTGHNCCQSLRMPVVEQR